MPAFKMIADGHTVFDWDRPGRYDVTSDRARESWGRF